MKFLLTLAAMVAIAAPAMTFDLGSRAPDKPVIDYPENVVGERQGGDTLLDATVISLPYSGTGTTVGYSDDYDEVCPYTTSTSPDVVYTTTPATDVAVNIDLFGSAYDTKVYVYDESLSLVACNDDFHADYTSRLENVLLAGGMQYFVVIDGYGGDAGDYVLEIVDFIPCFLECPLGAPLEGEPPLENDYIDNWNGGCANDPDPLLQPLSGGPFCGVSGFYLANGGLSRDTDWFLLAIPDHGFLEIRGDAELATYMFELGPQDCNSVAVIQNVIIGPCSVGELLIIGTPGSPVWFWVGPTTFASPDGSDVYEYDYWIYVGPPGLATEDHSWTDVKSLFQ